jgi:hypothetical protein
MQTLFSFTSHQERRLQLVFVVVCFLGLLAASIHYSHAYLDSETSLYLIQNLRPIGFLSNVFDFKNHDYSIFRARELSYVFDILDSHFVRASFALGFPNYLSIVHYGCVLFIGISQLFLTHKYLRLSGWQNIFLVLLLLSSPLVVLSGFHFRSAKVLVGLFGWALAWLFYLAVREPPNAERSGTWKSALSTASLTLAMTLCDEQGVFLAAYFLMLSSLWILIESSRPVKVFFGAVLFATLLHFAYRFQLGPYLAGYFAGIELNSTATAAHTPKWVDLLAFRGDKGAYLLWLYFRFYGGGLYLTAVPLSLLILMGAHCKNLSKPPVKGGLADSLPKIVFWLTLLAFLCANEMMLTRHESMLWGLVVRVYYGIPSTTLLVAGAAFSIHRLLRLRPQLSQLVTVLLALCFIGNLFSLPGHVHVRRSEFFDRAGTEYELLGDMLKECVLGKAPGPLDSYTDTVCQMWRDAKP